jgi:hypothetical protein
MNNRKDDDGYEYLKNWLIFVVTIASWILYVVNGRNINSLSGNILRKIIIFTLIVDQKSFVYYTARKCFASFRTCGASANTSASQPCLHLQNGIL